MATFDPTYPHSIPQAPLLQGARAIQPAKHPARSDTVRLLVWIPVAAAAFHVAYWTPQTGFVVVGFLFALLQLAQTGTWRRAFYSGLAVGLLIAAVRLTFFWQIFSGGAVALWLVYAFWVGLFVALARISLRGTFGVRGWALLPFLWCGLEYFRSELYYLRFSWLSPGFAFGEAPWQMPLPWVGVYGAGFALTGLAAIAAFLWQRSRVLAAAVLLLGCATLTLLGSLSFRNGESSRFGTLRVAGAQMEFPTEKEVLVRLNELVRRYPEVELLVLSEYTFTEPIPAKIKAWCREHRRHLIVGGKDPVAGGNFYNTAFVISPDGEIVFGQVKSVPIQFFKDGLPAPKQGIWNSPWGRIGICICYDLSYRRVTDRLIRLGAQALVVPTMDVADWGARQHELHARVAPMRAAEYGIPIFRLASSGISQIVDQSGRVKQQAPFPGDSAMLSGELRLAGSGRLPIDTWLAPLSSGLSLLAVGWLLIRSRRHVGNSACSNRPLSAS